MSIGHDAVRQPQGRRRSLGGALAGLGAAILLATPAHAAIIPASVACVGLMCTATPDEGPVPVDPLGFTLDVDWQPQHVELLGITDGDWWALVLQFDFTGTHDGTESWGVIDLLDPFGVPVPGLNPQFDDSNAVGNVLTVNYQIFHTGVENQNYFTYGMQLALSDGSGVDSMRWLSARFSPAATGTTDMPEPLTLVLLGAGLAAAGRRLHRRG